MVSLGLNLQLSLGPIGLGLCVIVRVGPGIAVLAEAGIVLGSLQVGAGAEVLVDTGEYRPACTSPPPVTVTPTASIAPSAPAPTVPAASPVSPSATAAAVPAAVPAASSATATPSATAPTSPPPAVHVAAPPPRPHTARSGPSSAHRATVLLRPLGPMQPATAARGGMPAALLAMVVLAVLTVGIAAASTRFGGRSR